MSSARRQPVVLIVTYSEDNDCVARVMDAVAARGGFAHRFDTDRFATEHRLACRHGGDDEQLLPRCGEVNLDLRTVSSVWYRRIAIGQRITTTTPMRFGCSRAGAQAAWVMKTLTAFSIYVEDPSGGTWEPGAPVNRSARAAAACDPGCSSRRRAPLRL